MAMSARVAQTPALRENPTFMDAFELLLRTEARERRGDEGRELEEQAGVRSIWLPHSSEASSFASDQQRGWSEEEARKREELEAREAQALMELEERERQAQRERDLWRIEKDEHNRKLETLTGEIEHERRTREQLARACKSRLGALELQHATMQHKEALAFVHLAVYRWKGTTHAKRTREEAEEREASLVEEQQVCCMLRCVCRRSSKYARYSRTQDWALGCCL